MKAKGKLLPFAGPIQLENAGKNLYLVLEGERIAKRGLPNTPQAGTWISLGVEGIEFADADREEVEIKRYGKRLN